MNRLKERADVEGELMAILEQVVGATRRLTPAEVLAIVRQLGLSTPGDSAGMIRKDRDDR